MKVIPAFCLTAIITGCASFKLPDYAPTKEELKTVDTACGPESPLDIDTRFCRAGQMARITADRFETERRSNHRNQMWLHHSLVALGLTAAAGALADVHSSTLNSLTFVSGATTAFLAYANPSGKFDLYTSAWNRAACLERVSGAFVEAVREWDNARENYLKLDSELIRVRAAKREWELNRGGANPDHAAEAVRFLTALEQSLVAALDLVDNAESAFRFLPFRIEENLRKIQQHVEKGVREQTGSYEDLLAQLRADAEKIAGAERNVSAIEEEDETAREAERTLTAQRSTLGAAMPQFNPDEYAPLQRTIAEVARRAPLIVEANAQISGCVAGL